MLSLNVVLHFLDFVDIPVQDFYISSHLSEPSHAIFFFISFDILFCFPSAQTAQTGFPISFFSALDNLLDTCWDWMLKRSLSATSSVLTCVCFALEKTTDRQQRVFMSSPWLLMPGLQLICKSALY